MTKNILFIIEKNIIEDGVKSTNNNGGDTSLIFAAIQKISPDLRIFLTNSDLIINQNGALLVREISSSNLEELTMEKAKGYLSAALDYIVEKPTLKHFSTIILKEKIWMMPSEFAQIHNRAEPISLTEEYYKKLEHIFGKQIEENQIYNDPKICNKISDKQSIYELDQELPAEQKLGFATMIIDLNNFDKITDKKLAEFQNNRPLCIKPYNWFGGIGIILHSGVLTVWKLSEYLKQIQQEIFEDAKTIVNGNEEEAKKLAILPKIIIQEQALYPHFGDLRILVAKGKVIGGFLRVPKRGDNVGNLHFGGHPEAIPSIAIYKNDLAEIIRQLKDNNIKFTLPNLDVIDAASFVQCLHNLENSIENVLDKKGEISKKLSSLFYIGVDGLLHQRENQLQFCINEMNVTCPMGQAQFDMAKLALQMLENNDFGVAIYNILKPYFSAKITYDNFVNFHPYVKYAAIKEAIGDALNRQKIDENTFKQNLKNELLQKVQLENFYPLALDIIKNDSASAKIFTNSLKNI
jgi:hypothetical protein